MSDLYRAQILLEQEQHEKLSKLAAVEGRSMSAIVREALAEYLVERNGGSQHQQELDALERLVQIREKVEARYGVYHGDLVGEIRAEEEAEWDEFLQGER